MSANHKNEELAGFSSKAIHAGYSPCDSTFSDIVQPISLSTVFEKVDPTLTESYCYSRFGNPNRTSLENSLTALEGAKHGEYLPVMCFTMMPSLLFCEYKRSRSAQAWRRSMPCSTPCSRLGTTLSLGSTATARRRP